MKTDCLKGIDTLRYSDIFLAMYSDNGSSCLHRNHSHVLVYMYSGELEIKEHKKITRLHKGDCAFIRKDFSVQAHQTSMQNGAVQGRIPNVHG